MLDRAEDEAVPGGHAPLLARLGALEPPRVVRLRGERGELRPQAPGALEEDAAVGRHGRLLLPEQVLEDGDLRLLRHRALRDLRELVRVAEEDDRLRARPERERVRERDLAGLVDEQVVELRVELLAAEEPARPGDELVVGLEERLRPRLALDERPLVDRLRVPARRLLEAAELDALRERVLLDLGEELVDRLVALRGDRDPLARSR